MRVRSWEHFEHDADIGLRASAATREALFEAMGEALTALITDPAGVRVTTSVEVHCEAPDDATLLVDWLNALIFEMATRSMLFGEWQVSLEGHRLQGRAAGEPVDRERHQPVVEVKGATYTDLAIGQAEDGSWRAQCVVDV